MAEAALFPFFGDGRRKENAAEAWPQYKEIAWDFQNNIPRLENGDFLIVTENEAIKTWCYKALKTERFRYLIYSRNYGSELDGLIGQSYMPSLTRAECVRYIEEALLINPYIKGIANVEVTFSDGLLGVTGDLETVYGKTEIEVKI